MRKFDTDDTAGAYEQLVDKLLSREQYGEHMARYWLDLVRFYILTECTRTITEFSSLPRLGDQGL